MLYPPLLEDSAKVCRKIQRSKSGGRTEAGRGRGGASVNLTRKSPTLLSDCKAGLGIVV